MRRIDFQGNLNTRDKVIRRELLIDEGDLYSQQLWETSILRLNQLGYFDPLKPEDAATMTRDTKTNTVDLLLKVKERGKNSIQLNGGVSGISGSFIGFSYSTNNFLGLGETLSLNAQIGTLLDNVTLGFTEPYLFDKPYQLASPFFTSVTATIRGARLPSWPASNLIGYYNSLGTQNLLNYVSNSKGFTTFVSHQLRRSFARDRPHLFVQRSRPHATHHMRLQSTSLISTFRELVGPILSQASNPAPSRLPSPTTPLTIPLFLPTACALISVSALPALNLAEMSTPYSPTSILRTFAAASLRAT